MTGSSVRLNLRHATRARHEAVHLHPLFSRLLAANITAPELEAINLSHLRVFTQVETTRCSLSLWPELTLQNRIMALRADLSHAPSGSPPASKVDPAYVLGGLYVAFGSAFGAGMIAKSLKRALPDNPITYYDMGKPEVWKLLCARLELLDTLDIDHAIEGANAVFNALLLTPPWVNPNATNIQRPQIPPRHIG